VDGDLAQDPSLLSAPREVLVRGTAVDLTHGQYAPPSAARALTAAPHSCDGPVDGRPQINQPERE
jgi:hypothetical protein